MYKEYRDTTLNGAVEQMYDEMGSRHRVRAPCLQVEKGMGKGGVTWVGIGDGARGVE